MMNIVAQNTRSKATKVVEGLGESILPWTSISKFRSFILDDSFTDLAKEKLNIPYGKQSIFAKQGCEFEKNICDILKEKFPEQYVEFDRYDQYDGVQDAINLNFPIIIQAPLKDDVLKVRGIADLLVRVDYIPKIFENVTLPIYNQIGDFVPYVVIDIKFKKLQILKSGFNTNSDDWKFYNFQVRMYNHMLTKLQQQHMKYSYFMGRGVDKVHTNPFQELSVVDNTDTSFMNYCVDGLRHLEHIKKFHHLYEFDNLPKKFFPRLSVESYVPEIQRLKREVVKYDVTMLPNVGIKQRELVNFKGWNDDNLNVEDITKNPQRREQLQKIINIQKDPEKSFDFTNQFNLDWDNAIFLDFETLPNIVNTDPYDQANTINNFVFTIGALHNGEMTSITARDYSLEAELRVFKKFLKYCRDRGYPKIIFYHADKRFFDYMCDRHLYNVSTKYCNIINDMKYNWFDLCAFLKDINFVAKGLFDYKLKNVVDVLNLCEYPDMNSGVDALEVALEHYIYERNPAGIKRIEEYNYYDCYSMELIYKFLMENK